MGERGSEIIKDLLGGRHLMCPGVVRVGELVRHPGPGSACNKLPGLRHSALHALTRRCEHQLRSKYAHELAPFKTHAFRHDEHTAVAPHGGHGREGDPCVATGRFYYCATSAEEALLLSPPDHEEGRTVLRGSKRIEALGLDEDLGTIGGDMGQPDHRRPSYELCYIIINHA